MAANSTVKLEWHGARVTANMRREAVKRVTMATEHMRDALVETLSGNGSGRRYRVPGTSRTYAASAPGQPPAVRLGRLRQSIQAKVEQHGDETIGNVGSDLDYAEFLERGTRKMRPRPWLMPTFEREKGKLQRIIEEPEWTP